MQNLGLNNGKTDGIPNCCYACINGEPEGDMGEIRCDRGTLMTPNEFCYKFELDKTRNPDQVVDFVQEYFHKNTGI